MKGTSQNARDAALRAFDPVASAAGKDGARLAAQLFAVVDALDGSGSLRRALTDPSRPAKDKAALAANLFSGSDERVRTVVGDLVKERWSEEEDLVQSVEDAGSLALLAQADAADTLHQVEEELFRFERELTAHRSLLTALGDRSTDASRRVALLKDVVGNKVGATTLALLERKVAAPRDTRLLNAVRELVQAAAERRERLVARVTAAVELSAAQRNRLATILKDAFGHDIQVNVAVDPEVLGGIKVQVGSEVVDGTIVSRLADARRRLVGS
ncbi:F0F1 ATP synthase subunit delta [Demequina sp. TTPB684]|uniref:F0F1 ATP synthase subunit delta n=1 Tax=unclassified Demequina TaxID=2620311 RepID=UPI001CF108D2|nr:MULTISPECIES: F0F1 ATP synthase subunit delta [unclassified Demequina]MCB2411768.1 F0F1 ATP synthase subunit delta [Demequina sp. TTPB684]UPU88642.1 F0F1 ATP synthase subunit delta [Demequina sp. TMPB413]